MRLLVSVRSADEARAAVRGGADIIDAKEPRAGVLAPVLPDVLTAIERAVPSDLPLSVALGDIGSAAEAGNAVASLAVAARPGGVYVKFALASGAERTSEIVAMAVATARAHGAKPGVVVAAYVDRLESAAQALEDLVDAASAGGAYAVLLDTAEKNGRSLFDWCDPEWLAQLTSRARWLGLQVAMAGSVNAGHLSLLQYAGADIVGVRGAVCTGGRTGRLSEALVAAMVSLIRPRMTRTQRIASLGGLTHRQAVGSDTSSSEAAVSGADTRE